MRTRLQHCYIQVQLSPKSVTFGVTLSPIHPEPVEGPPSFPRKWESESHYANHPPLPPPSVRTSTSSARTTGVIPSAAEESKASICSTDAFLDSRVKHGNDKWGRGNGDGEHGNGDGEQSRFWILRLRCAPLRMTGVPVPHLSFPRKRESRVPSPLMGEGAQNESPRHCRGPHNLANWTRERSTTESPSQGQATPCRLCIPVKCSRTPRRASEPGDSPRAP